MTASLAGRWLGDSPDRALLVGDLHRSWHAPEVIRYAARVGAKVVVQVGDLGWEMVRPGATITPSLEIETTIPEAVAETGIPFFWIEGNHDRHDLLAAMRTEQCLGPGALLEVAPGVVHLPRGYRLPWGERGWLCIGGAVSISGRPVAGEAVSDTEANEIIAGNPDPAQVVVAHDTLWSAPLTGGTPSGPLARSLGQDLPWPERIEATWWDEDRIVASDEHQRRLRRIADRCLVPGGVWVHGHHHLRYSLRIEPAGWQVEGLGTAGQPISDLTLLVDIHGRPASQPTDQDREL
ncbi:MAG: metallophosphoesterase [Propionicimonas sp.]|uniref:metallophosphoesterase n=1 Tax=Propionicimonas sp. TaxID=1955623 RepID=UPI003D11CCFF